jgi:hypothetical protein
VATILFLKGTLTLDAAKSEVSLVRTWKSEQHVSNKSPDKKW